MNTDQKNIEHLKTEVIKLISSLDDEAKQIVLLESSKEVGSPEWAEKVTDLMKRMGMIKNKD
jgi:translation elongation factor EF-Tu-like GTPase